MFERPTSTPPGIPWERHAEIFAEGDPVAVDTSAAYLRGDFHPQIVLHGGTCQRCARELRTVTATGPGGITRARELPVKVPRDLLERGGVTCRCGGTMELYYTEGDEGGIVLTTTGRIDD